MGPVLRFVALLFLLMFSIMMIRVRVVISIPPSPVDCDSDGGCEVSNAYGTWPDRTKCKVAKLVFPKTEGELVAAVAQGVANHQKMKVISRGSHSIPKLVCPGGQDGLLISTRDYNTTLAFDQASLRVVADSGVTLRQLIDSSAAHNMALPYAPYWEGVSLGGMLGTGAHGSSLFGKGSAVHEYVLAISLVVPATPEEGYAKIIHLTESDPDLNAAKVSLGVLGVISQVTLQLQPMFKRSLTNQLKTDSDLETEFLAFGRAHEFADFTWYPSQKKVVYRMDDRVFVNTSGDGVNDFIGFQPTSSTLLETTRNNEDLQEATRNAMGKCLTAQTQSSIVTTSGGGYKNSEWLGFTNYPVVGFQHLMQSSGNCLYADSGLALVCPWDPHVHGLFFHQTTVAIPTSKAADFISDVKKLRDLNNGSSLCGLDLYNGVLMRFVKASSAYLGGEEDALDFDITYYRSHDAHTPRLNEDVVEEMEQMALFKYGGRPHWGKNRPIAFDGVMAKYSQGIQKFLEVKQRLDPEGLFSSEWSDWVLGVTTGKGGGLTNSSYCALEGLCICSEDLHCAPQKGYFCQSGLVYTQARVCRYHPS